MTLHWKKRVIKLTIRLTYKERATYNCIREYVLMHGYPPSYKELGDMMGVKSSSTVYTRVQNLISVGLLESDHEERTPRAIRLKGTTVKVPKADDALELIEEKAEITG